ncbi:MAG TPA: DegT/DnrJ/EryC1/StrS family aminotransferase [Chthoniobacterales bacterium]|jgi:dTDP-4-amino-4,6-dideoxygalactose transaminase
MDDRLAGDGATKSELGDLAIFGGSPAFKTELHVGRPNIGSRERLFARVADILDRRWLTNDGPCVKELERRVCEVIEVKHCIAVCNATAGLEVLLKSLRLSGEVILPSFTFVATAHALEWLGLRPVFADIDPATHNLDPRAAAPLINQRTSAILGVHLWGRPCDVEALVDLAQRHNLKLLFDAAHAFACSHNGRMLGGFGDAEIFSFHATKFINSFEGGAIVTNNDELASRLRLMRNFGFAGLDNVTTLGINAKMNEAAAAMGLVSLDSVGEFVEINRANYHSYRQQLATVPGISLLVYNEKEKCNYQYVVIEIDEAAAGINRDMLDEILWSENVLTRRYFYPGCHRMEPYRSTDPDAGQRLRHTATTAERVLCLPTGSAVGASEIATICRLIELIVKSGAAVKNRMLSGPVCRHPLRRSVATA